jgi:hypothetical protein
VRVGGVAAPQQVPADADKFALSKSTPLHANSLASTSSRTRLNVGKRGTWSFVSSKSARREAVG